MTTLHFNKFCLSQREAACTRREPFSGLSFGMGSFSLRETGAEKFRVEHCVDRPVDTQIDLGGRPLEQSSTLGIPVCRSEYSVVESTSATLFLGSFAF